MIDNITYFKVGFNFTEELLNEIILINSNNYCISEVYGSTKELSYLTARPEYRLPEITREKFLFFVDKLNTNNISFNYVLNSNDIGSKQKIIDRIPEIKRYISFLIESGVTRFTVSLPIMAEIIRSVNSNVFIEISTIARIESISQIAIWKELYNINRVCVHLSKNRNIQFLMNANKFCKENNIELCLMVNEFCGNGLNCNGYITGPCIFRDHCYSLHSKGYDENDSSKLNGYPLSKCILMRASKINWIKLNFIRPEDLFMYENIGINLFKITGRTASTEYIIRIIHAYINRSYDGNLLSLWFDVNKNNNVYISNKKLNGFIKYWFINRDHRCSEQICGVTCNYCNNYYEKNLE